MFKIAILGPESTGKTELAKSLAAYYKSDWVAEYAREYVEKLTEHYTFNDVCNIAHRQIVLEKEYENHNFSSDFVFFDTDLIITKVWFEYCYHEVPEYVTNRLKEGFFDLYLLCEPDLPWEPDSVREHGADRQFFFDWYKKEIEQTGKPYVIVNGFDKQRVENAVKAIQQTFNIK
ncbi:MAG: ATP-binding protein [Paludibacter sp.]|nr:ATP-binding protein [Paludibacter sp.]